MSRRLGKRVLLLLTALAGSAPAGTQEAGVRAHRAGELEVFGTAEYDWEFTTLDEARVSFESLRGEVVVMNAWATWCPPCVREMESFAALRETLRDTDVHFLFITSQNADHVRSYLRRQDWKLPVILEEDRVPEAFGLWGLPTTWVVDRRGRIVLKRQGAARWDTPEIERFLRYLAAAGS